MLLKFTLKNFTKNVISLKLFSVIALLFAATISTSSLQAQTVYAVTTSGNLVSFSATAPGTITSTVALTGLTAGQSLQGLDFRPATGQLYAVGYNSTNGQTQVYLVKTATGLATPVGAAVTLATGMANLGVDFNPTVDRIRVTSSTGQNYRLNPNDGTITFTDTPLAYAAGDMHAGATPNVYTVAYTNNFSTATTTTLYFYDYSTNKLGTILPPNNGTLNTIGSSTIAPSTGVGLDLDIFTNTAGANFAYLTANTAGLGNNFYTVNLGTGAATIVGSVGSGLALTEMAIQVTPPQHSRIIYGISGNNLVTFNSATPATILSTTSLTGLGSGETILGIDFRPATGELFALGSLSRLYTINLTTGALTQVGTDGGFTLNGTRFGFDFNPTVDRIRLVSNTEQNLRLNPITGGLAATDVNLAYAAGDVNAGANPNALAIGYTNSFAGSTATTLYHYDSSLNILGTINPPNNGTLNTLGAAGLSSFAGSMIDMDISSDQVGGTNVAYLTSNTSATATNLYRVNLTTGAVTSIGVIGSGITVSAIAVYIPPVTPAKIVYALAAGNLVTFNSNAPSNISSSMPLSGITAGQVVEGLDFRPATGQLYALGYNATNGQTQLYTINTATGVATSVAPAIPLAVGMSNLSVDFNPTVDRIRVTSSTGQNYRLNPVDGTLSATDTNLSYASGDVHAGVPPQVYAAAYTNSFAGSTSTTIYYYDFNLDKLATSALPNTGALNTVGLSGIFTASGSGLDLDISANQSTGVNTAFLSANVSGAANNFYVVDLPTGEARFLGVIGSGNPITEMAVSITDVPLPVTLVSFNARKAGATSELTWTTNTEINNNFFVIERSADGNMFKPLSNKIFSKAISGNSTVSLDYNYTDVLPVKGDNYYRLLQVDKDGRAKYSQVLRVQFGGVNGIRMYPNPVKDNLLITGSLNTNTELQVRVTDVSGRVMLSNKYNKQAGEWNVQLNLSGLMNGVYYVQVYEGKKAIYNQSIYKQ